MIDIDFKNSMPEQVWFSRIDPDKANNAHNLLAIINNLDSVQSITASRVSKHLIAEHFRNLPIPQTMPQDLFFTGEFARQILGQLIRMALSEEPFLMGYYPIDK